MSMLCKHFALMSVITAAVSLTSCGVRDGAPDTPNNFHKEWHLIENAVPKAEAKSRYGNPSSYEVFGKRYFVRDSSTGFVQQGIASWYGTKFHGRRTSSGETYNMYAMTAAHKTLPLPTYVEVVNQDNGRRAIVKVNDRGPFHEGRIIDLSYAAATKLGVVAAGTANVRIRALDPEDGTEQDGAPPVGMVNSESARRSGQVYVQVAAFSTEEKAFAMLGKLRDANFNSSRIHVDNKQGHKIYRVRIGPLPSTDVAQKLLTQLQGIKQDNAKIVSYN